MPKHVLYWLKQDLRVADNTVLNHISSWDCLLDIVYIDTYAARISDKRAAPFQIDKYGLQQTLFRWQSVNSFAEALAQFQHKLHVLNGDTYSCLFNWIQNKHIAHLVTSVAAGSDENQVLVRLKQAIPDLTITCIDNNSLFERHVLPFELDNLPKSFTPFRKKLEKAEIQPATPLIAPVTLPKPITVRECSNIDWRAQLDNLTRLQRFEGGIDAGQQHLNDYFKSNAPGYYKQTRDYLSGEFNSSKASLWLAHGCISARQLWERVLHYEQSYGENESTYWLKFELLWREYFFWYACLYQNKLFRLSGIKERKPLASFYPQRLLAWQSGSTPYPLVNAIMNELNQTGYISNRSRQIAASCLVNELGLDWRYGASYFESQLVDYDVASNWGNWQYIAGVGADPRGGRHFDIEFQQQKFDPNDEYISRWHPEGVEPLELDHTDMVDWPC